MGLLKMPWIIIWRARFYAGIIRSDEGVPKLPCLAPEKLSDVNFELAHSLSHNIYVLHKCYS